MGEVYRVLDTRLEREVALKLVSASYLSSDAGSGSPLSPRPHDTPGREHPTPPTICRMNASCAKRVQPPR